MQTDKLQQKQPRTVGPQVASSRNMEKAEYLFNENTATRSPAGGKIAWRSSLQMTAESFRCSGERSCFYNPTLPGCGNGEILPDFKETSKLQRGPLCPLLRAETAHLSRRESHLGHVGTCSGICNDQERHRPKWHQIIKCRNQITGPSRTRKNSGKYLVSCRKLVAQMQNSEEYFQLRHQ